MKKLVSVIVPVYNTKELLNRCVRSILNQTYNELELLLVDDGSTDGSAELCDELAQVDHRIVVIHQENSGQGVARNSALDVIKGEYIYFVDSDDYIKENAIELMIATIEEYQSDLCICGIINDHIFIKKECRKNPGIKTFTKEELFVSYLTEPYVRGVLWNKLYKASLFKDLRFSAIRAREDAELLYKIYGICDRAVYIPESLYIQYVRPGSTEQSWFSAAKLNTIQIYENLTEYIKENVPEITKYSELLKAKAIANVMASIAADKYFSKWDSVYLDLLEQLKCELAIHKEHDTVNNELYSKLSNIVENQKSFRRNGYKSRLKNEAITLIKKLAMSWRKI